MGSVLWSVQTASDKIKLCLREILEI